MADRDEETVLSRSWGCPESLASGKMKEVKIGIIGCGGIAQAAHIPNYQKLPQAEIVACCDIIKGKAEEAAEKFNIPRIFTDHRELLEIEEVDAVSVCTPNFAHMRPTVDALRQGKHVLVEKPMAMNAEEAQAMVDASVKSGRKLMIGLNYRWRADVQALKRFVDAGELGEIYHAKARCLRRRGIPAWGVFTQKDKQGGGPLVDLGVHVMDSAMYLMGFPEPKSVSGATYTKFGKRKGLVGLMGQWDPEKFTVEDYALGLIRFENGTTMYLEASFAANLEKSIFNFDLLGTEGGCSLDPPKIFTERNRTLIDSSPVYLKKANTHEIEIEKFVNCIIEDEEPPVTGGQGLLLQRIMDAIYRSAELGREVTV